MSSSVTKLSQLIIITQKADGSCNWYGPFGDAIPENPEEKIKFSGNIFAIKGRCSDNYINAVGFKFTYAYLMVIASELFPIGHGGGNYFDEHTLIHIPRIVGIRLYRSWIP